MHRKIQTIVQKSQLKTALCARSLDPATSTNQLDYSLEHTTGRKYETLCVYTAPQALTVQSTSVTHPKHYPKFTFIYYVEHDGECNRMRG